MKWVKVYKVTRSRKLEYIPIPMDQPIILNSLFLLNDHDRTSRIQTESHVFLDKTLALRQQELWRTSKVKHYSTEVDMVEDIGWTRDDGVTVNIIGSLNCNKVAKVCLIIPQEL